MTEKKPLNLIEYTLQLYKNTINKPKQEKFKMQPKQNIISLDMSEIGRKTFQNSGQKTNPQKNQFGDILTINDNYKQGGGFPFKKGGGFDPIPNEYRDEQQQRLGHLNKLFTEHQHHADDHKIQNEFPQLRKLSNDFWETIEKSVIQPLMFQLEESNHFWDHILKQYNKSLTFEDTSFRTGDRENRNVISVFDRYLPNDLPQDKTLIEAWDQRQQCEVFLVHPAFPPNVRNYIYNRLSQWIERGLKYSYREEQQDPVSKITDSHILENIIIKMFDSHKMEFPRKHIYTQGPKTNSCQLRPNNILSRNTNIVIYDVVVGHQTYRLKSIIEAFSLFFLFKEKENDKLYKEFPQELKSMIDRNLHSHNRN